MISQNILKIGATSSKSTDNMKKIKTFYESHPIIVGGIGGVFIISTAFGLFAYNKHQEKKELELLFRIMKSFNFITGGGHLHSKFLMPNNFLPIHKGTPPAVVNAYLILGYFAFREMIKPVKTIMIGAFTMIGVGTSIKLCIKYVTGEKDDTPDKINDPIQTEDCNHIEIKGCNHIEIKGYDHIEYGWPNIFKNGFDFCNSHRAAIIGAIGILGLGTCIKYAKCSIGSVNDIKEKWSNSLKKAKTFYGSHPKIITGLLYSSAFGLVCYLHYQYQRDTVREESIIMSAQTSSDFSKIGSDRSSSA